MNQIKRRGWVFVFLVCWISGMFGMAGAQSLNSNPDCVISKISDERVPFPLRKANTKFDLSENETYLLNGTVVNLNGRAYFKVDFASQPWLETERMLQFPYLLVDDSSVSVGQYNGRMVQMAVVARRNEPNSVSEGRGMAVKLEVILPPSPIRN